MKRVYDPTEDRKQRKPDHIDAILEKINNGEVKIRGKNNPKAKPKTAEPKPEAEKPKAPEPSKFSDEQFIAALKEIDHPATSREVSDKLGIANPEVGRQLVRSRMAKLAEEGKVKVTEVEKGRAARLYSVA
jgi:hypothetical protein